MVPWVKDKKHEAFGVLLQAWTHEPVVYLLADSKQGELAPPIDEIITGIH